MLRTILLAASLLAIAPAAAALPGCTATPDGGAVCAFAGVDGAQSAGVAYYAADGSHADASYYNGPAFVGNALVAIAWVHHPMVGGAYGGVGGSDYDADGDYEQACVCGEVYAFALATWLPWGVGYFDWSNDGLTADDVYVQPLTP